MKRVAIHQPNFLPWLGYFHKMSLVDIFVFFDDVQFSRGKTFGNRVKIKTSNGELWLTVPVLSKGDLLNFDAILINNTFPWQRKIYKTIELSYGKAKYFGKYNDGFSTVFLAYYEKLIDLNIALIKYIAGVLGFNITFLTSSEIPKETNIDSEEKILAILKYVGATHYISGSGAGSVRYIDKERFRKENIILEWQHYSSPVYPQLWGQFIADLSILDMLFNCGEETPEILKQY